MLQNKIYYNYFLEIFKTFATIIFGLSLIALTVRAVSFLDLIVDSGYSLSTYFQYSILNIFGIAPKFFPLAFLIALVIFILKHENNCEFIILWTTGVKKSVVVNLIIFTSFVVLIIYLLFSVFLTPIALNKSRQLLNQSQFNSFLPTIRSQKFLDSFKGLTYFVEKKFNNEIKNIFFYDTGNNLKKFASDASDLGNTTIIAEKGFVEKKFLFLINGQIISSKKNDNDNEIIKFEELNIDLENLKTTVITDYKLQETSTFKLLSCFIKKNNDLKFCTDGSKKEIIPVLIRRLILPTYIPIIALICSMLLLKRNKFYLNKVSIFFYSFVLLVLAELILKYTGTNFILRYVYLLIPLISCITFYPLLIYKFSK